MAICVCSLSASFWGAGIFQSSRIAETILDCEVCPSKYPVSKRPDNRIPKMVTRLASFSPYISTNHQALQMNAIAPPYRKALLGTTHLALPISMHCGSTSEDPRHCIRRVRSFKRIYCPSIHRLVIILLKIARAYVGSFLSRVGIDAAPFDEGR